MVLYFSPPFENRYDWLALLDVDEVIVPRKHNSWEEMMAEVGVQAKKHLHLNFNCQHFQVGPQAKDYSSWSFRNIYFLDNMTDNLPEPNLHKEVPATLHMMNHIYRCFQTTDYPQINVNAGAPTTRNRDTTSNAFTTQSMFLPYIITIPQGA